MKEDDFNTLYSRYNTDDVFNRVVIIGLLDLLNNHMHYQQIWDENVIEDVQVPFMYDFGTSDERFAQDNYTFFGDSCFNKNKINGKFDMLPRGAIKYTGSNIDSANITNRFVKGTFMKNENGKLTSYTAMMYSIPLTFNFECEMWIDNMVTAFKIEQALRDTFYKNKTYNVLFCGMKVGCTAGFPEQSSIEKTTSYAFDSERQIKLTFSIAVETYQPSFDMSTAIESDKTMEHILYDVEVLKTKVERKQNIKFNELETSLYFSGNILPIKWNYSSNISDMCSVILSYIDEDTGEETTIDVVPANRCEYFWNIPDSFSDFEQPIVIFNDIDDVIKEPIVKIYPEYDLILPESFHFYNYGKFKQENGYADTTVEITDDNGEIIMSTNYKFKISDHHIDFIEPVKLDDIKTSLKYVQTYKKRHISLKITYGLDNKICDVINNLLII